MAAIRFGCPISFQASTIFELANARPLVSTWMAVAGSRSRHSFRTPMKSSQSDKGLSAGERQRTGCRINEGQALLDFTQDPPVINIFRWLRAHQAVIVASFRDQK